MTLLRAGTYSVKNTLTAAKGKITVAYPVVGKEPYRPPEPVSVECTERGFVPDVVDLKPAQGIVFRLGVPSRIKIDLVQPAKTPDEKRRRSRHASWRKPAVG